MPVYMRFVFLGVVGLTSYGLHAYLCSRVQQMVADAAVSLPESLVESVSGEHPWLLIALSALTLSYFAVGTLLHPRLFRGLAWLSGAWMGALTLLCLWAGVHHLAAAIAWLAGTALPGPTGVLGLVATSALWAWGLANVLRAPAVKHVAVPLAKLPDDLEGLRIVQLSDIHVGPTVGRRFMVDLVARTNALAPDLIVITGDLVDGDVEMLQ